MSLTGWIGAVIALLFVWTATCLPCSFWRWMRVLWVCRVSVFAVLASFFLLVYTPQGRDLFSDLGLRWYNWIWFFALLLGCAWVVHAVARCALQYDDWVPEAHVGNGLSRIRRRQLRAEFYCPALLVPRLLGVAIFVAVAWGMLKAYANVDDAAPGLPGSEETAKFIIWMLVATLGTAVVFFLLVWFRTDVFHRTRRMRGVAPEDDPDYPLLTGAVPLRAVLRLWVENLERLRVFRALFGLLGDLCGLVIRVCRPIGLLEERFRRWCPSPIPAVAPAGPVPAVASAPPREDAAPLDDEYRVPEEPTAWIDIAFFVVGIFIWVTFGLALIKPHFVAEWFPRALFVPLLIAGFVMATGWIAAWSHRLQTPFLALLVLVAIVLVYWFEHFHDARWVGSPQAQSKAVDTSNRQITFKEAVKRWTVQNKCENNPGSCPRPIIIAGAGGASRAGFLTVTVAGALIDLGKDDPSKYGNLRDRIFALSTVSGSSVGAVMIRAALSDALDDGHPDDPPCKASRDTNWFGDTVARSAPAWGARDPKHSWRDCFQQLMAGDFLSPVMVGLAFRDNFPLGNPITRRVAWVDRAVLLEEGFERRYSEITGRGVTCTGASSSPTGLCRRFGYHPDPKTAGAWIPLLFINGTSVATGRRIVVGDVKGGDPAGPAGALFKLAYDLGEIRGSQNPGHKPDSREQSDDIYLSTTATMSARFPIISPHGELRNRTGDIADRIVDGGYFENDGLATADDLALALEDMKLVPIVIRIENEPAAPVPRDHVPTRPDLPNFRENQLLEGPGAIVKALLATRSGHEDAYEAKVMRDLNNDPNRLFELSVYPLETGPGPLCRQSITAPSTMKYVSMSWWMSHPVQIYLDAQLCVAKNWKRLECELRAKGSSEKCS